MAKREFLQLAHPYKPAKHDITGWFMSEKLDGQRCLWDGGITNGLAAKEVPWANVAKDTKTRMATGLWSRYGKPIHAPQWWLDRLPNFPLDGELWAGRGSFQLTRSVVSKHIPNEAEWKQITFMVIDSPTYYDIFQDGVIDTPQYKKKFSFIPEWLYGYGAPMQHHSCNTFEEVYAFLADELQQNEVVKLHEQEGLGYDKLVDARMRDKLEEVLALGGEGLIIRDPEAYWIPNRTHCMIKVKPTQDAEAKVIGYVTGRETDKGSKLLGMMGAMIVDFNGKVFELSGFTDEERKLTMINVIKNGNEELSAYHWACANPEEKCPTHIIAKHFPRGSIVTFKYRELSDDGIPKEARYWRKP